MKSLFQVMICIIFLNITLYILAVYLYKKCQEYYWNCTQFKISMTFLHRLYLPCFIKLFLSIFCLKSYLPNMVFLLFRESVEWKTTKEKKKKWNYSKKYWIIYKFVAKIQCFMVEDMNSIITPGGEKMF